MLGIGDRMMRHIMKRKGIDSLESLRQQAIDSGVEFIACQMSMDVMGVKREELLDEATVGGVATYMERAEGCLLYTSINDLFDYRKGSDRKDRLGPERACAQGWISPRAMKRGIALITATACATGLCLLFYGGTELIVVGAVCVVFAFLYTAGPYPLAYHGWGDGLVIVFFGFVPVGVTYYVPVSYTHLDVYKRQPAFVPLPAGRPNRMRFPGADQLERPGGRNRSDGRCAEPEGQRY